MIIIKIIMVIIIIIIIIIIIVIMILMPSGLDISTSASLFFCSPLIYKDDEKCILTALLNKAFQLFMFVFILLPIPLIIIFLTSLICGKVPQLVSCWISNQ